MDSALAILLLGVTLGIRHAFDPDHLIAVSTIAAEYRNPLRAVWVGVSWGLGHTTTLFLVAVTILFLKVSVPERLAPVFEFLVGVMLVVLGAQVFWRLRKVGIHLHPHHHGVQAHAHFHSHAESLNHYHHRLDWSNLAQFLIAGIVPGEHRQSGQQESLKPFFRVKSFVVGTVHGLAGSAALMLLLLASLESRWIAVWYIVLFGLGSMAAMGLVTIFLAFPFSVSARLPRLNRVIQYIAAVVSILFGLLFIYQAGLPGFA